MLIEFSYAINGSSFSESDNRASSLYPDLTDQPAVSIGAVTKGTNATYNSTTYASHKITQIRHSSDTAFFYDGIGWNCWNQAAAAAAIRISGSRHGKFNPAKPLTTGIV